LVPEPNRGDAVSGVGDFDREHRALLVLMRLLAIAPDNHGIAGPGLTIHPLCCSGDEFAAVYEQLLEISGTHRFGNIKAL
jgi:hypothetical protein